MPKKRTPQQLRDLELCLGDAVVRRGRFKDALVAAMNRRKTVCVQCIVEDVIAALGEQYGAWAEAILRESIKESYITEWCKKHDGNQA